MRHIFEIGMKRGLPLPLLLKGYDIFFPREILTVLLYGMRSSKSKKANFRRCYSIWIPLKKNKDLTTISKGVSRNRGHNLFGQQLGIQMFRTHSINFEPAYSIPPLGTDE